MHFWLMQENLKWVVEANLKRGYVFPCSMLSLDSFIELSNHLAQFDKKDKH